MGKTYKDNRGKYRKQWNQKQKNKKNKNRGNRQDIVDEDFLGRRNVDGENQAVYFN